MKKQESEKGVELCVHLPFIPHNTNLPCEGGHHICTCLVTVETRP